MPSTPRLPLTYSYAASATGATYAGSSLGCTGSLSCRGRAGYKLVFWIQRTFDHLRHLRCGVIGNSQFDLYRLQRLVRIHLPYNRSRRRLLWRLRAFAPATAVRRDPEFLVQVAELL